MDEIRHHATFGHAYTGSVRSGMELPNAHLAIVEQAKIIDYLLNSDHPDNAGKARFFLDLGFNPQNWQSLADAFRDHAVNAITIRRVKSLHGTKYIVEGELQTPSDRHPRLRCIWIIDHGEMVPRLVTAYPV